MCLCYRIFFASGRRRTCLPANDDQLDSLGHFLARLLYGPLYAALPIITAYFVVPNNVILS